MLKIKSLNLTNEAIIAVASQGDEAEYEHCSLDHIADIPSDFMSPLASAIIHEEELGASLIFESLFVDREVDTYRPYSAAEFKAKSALISEEV